MRLQTIIAIGLLTVRQMDTQRPAFCRLLVQLILLMTVTAMHFLMSLFFHSMLDYIGHIVVPGSPIVHYIVHPTHRDAGQHGGSFCESLVSSGSRGPPPHALPESVGPTSATLV